MVDDCSATGMAADAGVSDQLPEPTRATAEFLLDAALRCDEQLLATVAAESDTTLTFGGADPYEFFGLPDDDTGVDAGLLTADEAADMRAGGNGYLGWRLGISGDGTWQFLVAGD